MKKEPGTGRPAPVNKVLSGGRGKKNVVCGKVNGVKMRILMDTGADFGVVGKKGGD